MPAPPAYVELHCRSNFSFLTGASHPEELVARAAELGYTGLALTDEGSLAGVVRAHEAAAEVRARYPALDAPSRHLHPLDLDPPRFHLIIGAEIALTPHPDPAVRAPAPPLRLLALAHNREGYGNLSELISLGRLRASKGHYRLHPHDLDLHTPSLPDPDLPADLDPDTRHLRGLPHCSLVLLPERGAPMDVLLAQARWMAATFGERAALAITQLRQADDAEHARRLMAASTASGVPMVATGAVLMHKRARKPLQDTLTAIRLGTPVAQCGWALAPNAEQHLRPLPDLSGLYAPEWLAHSVTIARRCTFSLDELRYEYPDEVVPAGYTATGYLREQTWQGAARRYPQGVPDKVCRLIEHELALIADQRYEAFFLTVYDTVSFSRARGILCQGRGSAANSAVCYCLGITEVNPSESEVLFERFISKERGEPPDIDVDFEHERREEVIQYLYDKYGTDRCALAAALTTYRTRGAVRDVGKALGLDADRIDRLAKAFQWFDSSQDLSERLREQGLDPDALVTRQWMELVRQVRGFPRHLSQHVGGFVISATKLSRLVPIENAAMDKRRVIQWDKDDLESLKLLKVDVLALGMLSALRRSLAFISQRRGSPFTLEDIPDGDGPTYDMICAADTIGVFQIESRAQQSMLPRLRPRTFYDLVIEVAIVRPGPIQGGMVHPYLKRRHGQEPVQLPRPGHTHDEQGRLLPTLDDALGRTFGIPIFQEQVMQVCVIAAGFTPGEADGLRRAMAAWRHRGTVHEWRARILDGMARRGYAPEFAEAIFEQIQGFGDYGFPESHAASFAKLTYLSSWIKRHEPAAFLAALVNSQPMGFYSVSQLVQDAQRHGVEVRAVDVLHSDWDCTLEENSYKSKNSMNKHQVKLEYSVRLGLRQVKGLKAEVAKRIMATRALWKPSGASGPDGNAVQRLALAADLDPADLQALARADALSGLAGHRRQQTWAAAGQERRRAAHGTLLHQAPRPEAILPLAEAPDGESVLLDYQSLSLSLKRHPVALLRERLQARGARTAQALASMRAGRTVWACGLVTVRQQPATAKGTIFVTLEDETGTVNVIVWKHVRETQRQALLTSRLMAVQGQWQSASGVHHLIAKRLVNLNGWLAELDGSESLPFPSRDFH